MIKLFYIVDEAMIITTQNGNKIPFDIIRTYIIKNIAKKSVRGKHAHKCTRQALFCIQGSMNIILDDGRGCKTIRLDKPEKGILIENMVWHEMYNFSHDAIVLVLASEYFIESDYIRNYQAFLKNIKNSA